MIHQLPQVGFRKRETRFAVPRLELNDPPAATNDSLTARSILDVTVHG